MKLHNKPLSRTSTNMHFSATQSEDDELIRAIDGDHKGPDDVFELRNEPDVDGISSFWAGVKRDLEQDPDWYTFADN